MLDTSTDPRFVPLLVAYEGLGQTIVATATAILAMLTVSVGKESNAAKSDMWLPQLLWRIFAHPVLVVLSRTTYAVYLVHMYVMSAAFYFRPKLTVQSYSLANLFLSTLQVYACSLLIAAPLAVFEQIIDPLRKRLIRLIFDSRDHRSGGLGKKENWKCLSLGGLKRGQTDVLNVFVHVLDLPKFFFCTIRPQKKGLKE